MGVHLSIKNVPEDQVQRLKERAKKNHRSLQGELRAIVEEALNESKAPTTRKKTVREVADYIATLGLTRTDEAVKLVREDRDR
jgi:plasmid stability protein